MAVSIWFIDGLPTRKPKAHQQLDFPAELSNKANIRLEIAFLNKGVNCNVLRPSMDSSRGE